MPSVTEVLSVVNRGHWMMAWKNRVGEAEANRVMQEAQVHGTKIHTLAERLAHDREAKVQRGMEPFADAIREFLDTHVRQVLHTELSLASAEQGFGGTLDLYCVLSDNSYAVVDFKTSSGGLTREHGLQVAAYAMLLREHGFEVNRRLVVRIKKDVPGKWYARSYRDHREDIEAFKAAVVLWRWLYRNKLLAAQAGSREGAA